MTAARSLQIDRIDIALHGVAPHDAALLARDLDAALAARLQLLATRSTLPVAEPLLTTALAGGALVDAVAARIVDLIGVQMSGRESGRDNESTALPGAGAGGPPWR